MNTIDLKPFCAPASYPLSCIHQPWTNGQFTYATNRRILVRVERRADVAENAAAPTNGVEQLFLKSFPATEVLWQPLLPFIPESVEERCADCGGTGRIKNAYQQPTRCDECNSTGKILPVIRTAIGNNVFSNLLLKDISTLPGLLLAFTTPENEPMAFKFTGGIGLISPMTKEAPTP